MTIRFLLKNGKEIDMKCDKFKTTRNEFVGNGMITGFEVSNVTENKILGINFNEVVAVYRLMIDEEKEDKQDANIKK